MNAGLIGEQKRDVYSRSGFAYTCCLFLLSTDNIMTDKPCVINAFGMVFERVLFCLLDPTRGEGGPRGLATSTSVAVGGTVAQAPPGGPRECAGCGKRITERFLLKAIDLFWHEDCLKCGCCDCRLGEVGSTLYTKANLILCKRDYLRYVFGLLIAFVHGWERKRCQVKVNIKVPTPSYWRSLGVVL